MRFVKRFFQKNKKTSYILNSTAADAGRGARGISFMGGAAQLDEKTRKNPSQNIAKILKNTRICRILPKQSLFFTKIQLGLVLFESPMQIIHRYPKAKMSVNLENYRKTTEKCAILSSRSLFFTKKERSVRSALFLMLGTWFYQ